MIGKYEKIERERRWLVSQLPDALNLSAPAEIEDLYLPETMMRVRRMDRGLRVDYKLTKKRSLPDSGEFALSTIYLSETEYSLFNSLPGRRLSKQRFYFEHAGHGCAVDVFANGKRIIEVEFMDTESMLEFEAPRYFGQEVTNEAGFTGFELAT